MKKPKCQNKYCKTPYDDVTYEPDPFDEELNDDDTPVYQCKNCREDSLMDI